MRTNVVLLLSLIVCSDVNADEVNPARKEPTAAADAESEQRIIVKFRSSSASSRVQAQSAADKVTALAARSGFTLKQSRVLAAGLQVVQMEPRVAGESLAEQLARVRADAAVEYAELDRRRYVHALPNDPLYSGQWYLQRRSDAPSAIDAEQGWETTNGSAGVVIADIDTGVLFDHPDLLRAAAGGRILPGYDFVSNPTAANDGDGRDADASDPGDWVTPAEVASATFGRCEVSDSSWHGTRVAGILGALANNGVGIAGTTFAPWILPVRVLGKCGGYDSDILAGMLWAGGIHVDGVPDNPYPAKIENLSLGASGGCPASYRDVIAALAARGVLVVVSAGNEGGPVATPANCPGVAAVAGLRHTGTKVGYSSLGREITIGAPAGNCVNSLGACRFSIDTTFNLGVTTPAAHGYTDQLARNVGTSFSAPIVAAIAALMMSVNGNLGPAHVISRLKEGALTPFPVANDASIPMCHVPRGPGDLQAAECSCTTQTCGAGMANVPGALTAALRPIAAVSIPATLSAGQNVELSGAGSAAACGHAIHSYRWSLVGAANGLGIAGADRAAAIVVAPTSGTYTVRLTVTDDVGREDAADVIVGASSATSTAPENTGTNACPAEVSAPVIQVSVAVSPGSAHVQAGGGTQAFTAAVANTSIASVIWQVGGITGGDATLGTISTAGVYTAPKTVPSPATVTVTAVWSGDMTRLDSAQVTVTPEPMVTKSVPSDDGGGGALDLLSLLSGLCAIVWRRRLRTTRTTRECAWKR